MDEALNGRRRLSGFNEETIVGSWRLGSACVSSSHCRVDCGMPADYGTKASPIQFKIDLKPKHPLVFAGKSFDDIEIWVKRFRTF